MVFVNSVFNGLFQWPPFAEALTLISNCYLMERQTQKPGRLPLAINLAVFMQNLLSVLSLNSFNCFDCAFFVSESCKS